MSNASEYAASVGKGIWEDYKSGHPFGKNEDYDPDIHDEDEQYLSVYDYLGEALDIEYRVSQDKRYRSAQVMISFGGPNAYIDTANYTVVVYWGGNTATWGLPSEFCDQLDDALEEMYGLS